MKPDGSAASNFEDRGRRILVAIGCDEYDHVSSLNSAEADAKSVFYELTEGRAAAYDVKNSALLLSPTKHEIERFLSKILLDNSSADTFAFYFAGHGELRDETFYLCPRDVKFRAISVTGVNIAAILRVVCELRPRRAYIVLDACYGGAISLDLQTVLKAAILSRAPSIGISMLASSKLNEPSVENAEGGVFTTRFVSVLRGTQKIFDDAPYLGLRDIAGAMLSSASGELKEQGPNFTELNLTGTDSFCRNPNYSGAVSAQSTDFGTLRFSGTFEPGLAAEIWRSFLDLPDFRFSDLSDVFGKMLRSQAESGRGVSPLSLSISRSFSEGVADHVDTFAGVQVKLAMIRSLMPLRGVVADARAAIESLCTQVTSDAAEILVRLSRQLSTDKYTVLSDRGGLADLYFLPLRVSQLLGWIGLVINSEIEAAPSSKYLSELRELSQKLLLHYGNSLVAVGEDQAPHLLSFLCACRRAGWQNEGEEVVGRLYFDFNENFGRVLVNDPSANDVVDYLFVRKEGPIEFDGTFVQNPSEFLTVIMIGAALFELDDVIDQTLIQLDHSHFSVYVPASYNEFYLDRMSDGQTLIPKIGGEVCRVNDFRMIWSRDVRKLIGGADLDNDEGRCAAYMMSLALPNRLPLFIVPDISPNIPVLSIV